MLALFNIATRWIVLILGCIVKAFDTTDAVRRPTNSYHANLFYYNVGIDFYDHQDIFLEYQNTEYLKTLKTLLEENEGWSILKLCFWISMFLSSINVGLN